MELNLKTQCCRASTEDHTQRGTTNWHGLFGGFSLHFMDSNQKTTTARQAILFYQMSVRHWEVQHKIFLDLNSSAHPFFNTDERQRQQEVRRRRGAAAGAGMYKQEASGGKLHFSGSTSAGSVWVIHRKHGFSDYILLFFTFNCLPNDVAFVSPAPHSSLCVVRAQSLCQTHSLVLSHHHWVSMILTHFYSSGCHTQIYLQHTDALPLSFCAQLGRWSNTRLSFVDAAQRGTGSAWFDVKDRPANTNMTGVT